MSKKAPPPLSDADIGKAVRRLRRTTSFVVGTAKERAKALYAARFLGVQIRTWKMRDGTFTVFRT